MKSGNETFFMTSYMNSQTLRFWQETFQSRDI
jgi:hypothetical protein